MAHAYSSSSQKLESFDASIEGLDGGTGEREREREREREKERERKKERERRRRRRRRIYSALGQGISHKRISSENSTLSEVATFWF